MQMIDYFSLASSLFDERSNAIDEQCSTDEYENIL